MATSAVRELSWHIRIEDKDAARFQPSRRLPVYLTTQEWRKMHKDTDDPIPGRRRYGIVREISHGCRQGQVEQ
jgi:hypothetical protein